MENEAAALENTEDDDDFGGKICFFPTEITTLKYRVLKTDLTSVGRKLIEEVIQENESSREKLKIEQMLSRYNLEDSAVEPDE